MQHEVTIILPAGEELRVDLSHEPAMEHEAGRRWLDEQFNTLDCEPLRPTGKVLLADKVLVVAKAAQKQLTNDPAWRKSFAVAAAAVLSQPVIRVDIPDMTVGF